MSKSDQIAKAEKPRVRGFAAWKPDAESLATVMAVQDVIEQYAEYLPLTVRQIFYRLVATGRVGKTEKDYKRLAEKINRARRARMVSFDDIRDDGAIKTVPLGYRDEDHIRGRIEDVLSEGLNKMAWQPIHQIIMSEAQGMVPMLERVADRFGSQVWTSGGFNSTHAKHELAVFASRLGKPLIVHHVGDHDPSGVHVYQSMLEDVEAFCHHLGGDVTFKRIAVTPDQIAIFNLPAAPTKSTDARAFDSRGTVQCEALPPDVLSNIAETALAVYFDQDVDADGYVASAATIKRLIAEFGGEA